MNRDCRRRNVIPDASRFLILIPPELYASRYSTISDVILSLSYTVDFDGKGKEDLQARNWVLSSIS